MEQNFINRINKLLRGRSVFLIGMMASGKSKTGPKLAELLKYKFIDVDILVEKVSKTSIELIFQKEGEDFFRQLETQCLQEIIKIPSTVVSTGGGIILRKENWGILRQGIVVWLDINQEVALERLKMQNNIRPLLQGADLKKKYIDIFNSRKELYSQADIRIQVKNESIEEISNKIISEINNKIGLNLDQP
tara:strand:+ start:1975 stop:2547 length:573 start_codon:yes stop_codon:yes gene_type:complete